MQKTELPRADGAPSADKPGTLKPRWSAPQVRKVDIDRPPYEVWAARARRQAGEATTATARAIHLGIAEEYDGKAADDLQRRVDMSAKRPA